MSASGSGQLELTAHQKQYLAKMFALLEQSKEWGALGEVGELATYGPPFLPEHCVPVKKYAKQDWNAPTQSPILRYMYRHFLLEFPGLKEAPQKFWTKVVQPTFDDVSSRNLSGSKERSEVTKRRTVAIAFTQYIGTIFNVSLEPVARNGIGRAPIRPDAAMYAKIDQLFPEPQKFPIGGLLVFIAKVDIVTMKQTGSKVAQYMICTRQGNDKDVFVYRDYQTFRKFDDDLAKEGVSKPGLPSPGPDGIAPKHVLQKYLRSLLVIIERDPQSKLSFKIKSFLMGFPLDLPQAKVDDLRERILRDESNLADSHALWVSAGEKVTGMRLGWQGFVEGLLASDDGLKEIFGVLEQFPSMYDIPKKYRRAEEWARVYVAYSFHYLFVTAPNAAEAFYILQVLHHLFPYGIARQLLKIANPAHMIKAIVTLLFGGPIGTKSVFSRIIAYMTNKDIKQYKKQIKVLEKLIDDPKICATLKKFVDATAIDQASTRERSRVDGVDIVVSILTAYDTPLSREEAHDVVQGHKAFTEGVAAGDSTLVADNEDRSKSGPLADKFKSMKRLLRFYALKRTRKQATDLWSSSMENFFKGTLDLYFQVISDISKASNLSDRLGDLKRFLDDLIQCVLTGKRTPGEFVDLCERHEQSLYFFTHEIHANGHGLTDSLVAFFKRGLDFMHGGIISPTGQKLQVDLEAILMTQPELIPKILAEIDTVAKFTLYNKVKFELSVRHDVIGNKMKVNSDALLRDLIESENDGHMIRTGASSGSTTWGYFYDGQVIDNATAIVIEGEEYGGVDAKLTLEQADAEAAAGEDGAVGTYKKQPTRVKQAVIIKSPVLIETRKLIPAYLDQIGPTLDQLAKRLAWQDPKHRK